MSVRKYLRVFRALLAISPLALAACSSTPSASDGVLALETHRFT